VWLGGDSRGFFVRAALCRRVSPISSTTQTTVMLIEVTRTIIP
jgi:hypothetical protein